MLRHRPAPTLLDGIRTPDARYIVVRRRLWRATNPSLPAAERTRWTRELMAARRAAGRAGLAGDLEATRAARDGVDRAKRALGERGPVWWDDATPDYNRRMVSNTPYSDWYERLERNAAAIGRLLDARAPGGSICPSDVARARYPRNWRKHLDDVREAARHLARHDVIAITQGDQRLDPDRPFRGPIRLRRG